MAFSTANSASALLTMTIAFLRHASFTYASVLKIIRHSPLLLEFDSHSQILLVILRPQGYLFPDMLGHLLGRGVLWDLGSCVTIFLGEKERNSLFLGFDKDSNGSFMAFVVAVRDCRPRVTPQAIIL